MNADQVRAAVLTWMQYTPADWECNDKKKWGIIEMLNNAVRLGASNKEANIRRKAVLAWLFREDIGMPAAIGLSSKVLDVRHWFALIQYADATLDIETGQWKPKPEFSDAMVVCWIALERWNYEMQTLCGMEEDDGKD